MASITIHTGDIDDAPITLARTAAGEILITGLGAGPGPQVDDAPGGDAISAIRARWGKQRPGSGAFSLVDRLLAQGLDVVAPRTRKEGKDVEPYVRLLAKSATSKPVAAYINSSAMIVLREPLRPIAAGCAGADVHPNGHVYFDVDDIDACLAAVNTMLEA